MSFLFEQLPLALQLRDDATFDNFYPGSNGLVLETLKAQLNPGERYIYLYGALASGRSHLLQAACHLAESQELRALYLPLAELRDYPPVELFEGLTQLDLICLDDIDAVVGHDQWEQELFHLFNRLQQNQTALLIAANRSVRELSVQLPDLASRLSWGALFNIKALSDEQCIQAMQMRAGFRGLELTAEVAQYIYHRCQRDLDTLLEVLSQLDRASLKHQRRLTIPFVKSVMNW